MTLLVYVKKPGFELFVCGGPSREWLEWVRTTAVPLTSGQVMWREIAQDRVDRLGLRVEPRRAPVADEPVPEPSSQVGRLSPLIGRRAATTRECPHQDLCDQCGHCERCDCYDCEL